VTYDQFSQPSYGVPVHFMGTYAAGGDQQRDDSGVEFVPASTYWMPASVGLRRDWLIARGTLTTAPVTAERIRKVAEWDDTALGFSNDMAVYT
jgi:hypothetical protein